MPIIRPGKLTTEPVPPEDELLLEELLELELLELEDELLELEDELLEVVEELFELEDELLELEDEVLELVEEDDEPDPSGGLDPESEPPPQAAMIRQRVKRTILQRAARKHMAELQIAIAKL